MQCWRGLCRPVFHFLIFFPCLPLRPSCAGDFPENERKLSKKIIEFCFFVYNRSTRPLQFLRRHYTLRISVISVTMSLRRLPDEYKISMTRQQLLSRGSLAPSFFWYIVHSLPDTIPYVMFCRLSMALVQVGGLWFVLCLSEKSLRMAEPSPPSLFGSMGSRRTSSLERIKTPRVQYKFS